MFFILIALAVCVTFFAVYSTLKHPNRSRRNIMRPDDIRAILAENRRRHDALRAAARETQPLTIASAEK